MILFEGDFGFSEKGLRALNYSLYFFIEPVIDLMDILHLNPNNYNEMRNELGSYFPEYLIREDPRKCIDVLLDLAAWTQDDFLHRMTVLHEYALYMILLNECEALEGLGEDGPRLLRMHFSHSGVEVLTEEEREWFDCMGEEGFDAIVDYIYKDLDFLFVDRISSWELTNSPINYMLGVDISHLSPLLPLDVRSHLDDIYDNSEIYQILNSVQSVLRSLEAKAALLEQRTEEEINAQIAMGLNLALTPAKLGVSQETPFGYSPFGVGEVDFYVFDSALSPSPKAIGESKMWGRFRMQIDQLFGYMNEGVSLGFTITINKHQKLSTVLETQKSILENYSVGIEDFRALDIHESKFGGWICLHRHPENNLPFITNHFTLNLFRPSRKKAAASRKKKKPSRTK